MTSLDKFLNKKEIKNEKEINTSVIGSFSCQNFECKEVNLEAFINKEKNKLLWSCKNGHESSVAF